MAEALRGAMVGTGFFAHMQMAAWQRVAGADIVAVCDVDEGKARAFSTQYGIKAVYGDIDEMLNSEAYLNFVDIVTRPDSHLALVEKAAKRRLAVLCQKPLAPTFEEARKIVQITQDHDVPFMVNENWRWQAWYREMKSVVDAGTLGKLFHATVHMRTGDGRGETPYAQQPYFRDYSRMLVFETLVHFIDTLRMFLGEVTRVYAVHGRINPVIAGEDLSLITLEFEGGATAVIDANRYTEPKVKSEAFARVTLEGSKGEIMLTRKLKLHVQLNNGDAYEHPFEHPGGYKGGSCLGAQAHFIQALQNGTPFETNGPDYLKTLAVVEAVYASAEAGQAVVPTYPDLKPVETRNQP